MSNKDTTWLIDYASKLAIPMRYKPTDEDMERDQALKQYIEAKRNIPLYKAMIAGKPYLMVRRLKQRAVR